MNYTTVFHVLDVADIPPLTPAQAKDLLNDLFKCGYETVSDQKTQELLSNIHLIQMNLINKHSVELSFGICSNWIQITDHGKKTRLG